MSVIKDFLVRQKIDAKAQALVAENFTALTIKKINDSNSKKAQRKLDTNVQKLRQQAQHYVTEMKLGIYGKSRLYKALQESMLQAGIQADTSSAIIKSFLLQ